MPFEMKQPRFNLETEAALAEARLIPGGKPKEQNKERNQKCDYEK